ncbi:uncharacterized protein STEHIDRAFT_42365, partial [Stereum hirsutum FP-91666 SS1]|uniref:uncharacterized protein n=1 Tax=Stereum hirsutum (strain FP-91666) TaxID=721885 RepID=UPI0004449A1C
FYHYWCRGIPVLVDNSMDKVTFPRQFDPKEYLVRKHGKDRVCIVDCESQSSTKSTLGSFLSDFGAVRTPHQPIMKVKVVQDVFIWRGQDWPPSQNLSDASPELHAEIEKTIAVPDLARADGLYNTLGMFPKTACAPDPGPKMYMAHASMRHGIHIGSTRLHKDITAAYNL